MAETQKITKALSRADRGGGRSGGGAAAHIRPPDGASNRRGRRAGPGGWPATGARGSRGSRLQGAVVEVVVVVEVVEVSGEQLSARGAAAVAGRSPCRHQTQPPRSPLHSTFKTLTFAVKSVIVQFTGRFQIVEELGMVGGTMVD